MNSQDSGCGGILVAIIVLGMLKSAGISWLTHGKYGWTLGKSFLILSEIAAGIILLVAVCAGIVRAIDWLKMKRAKQRGMCVKSDAHAADEIRSLKRKR